jgi:cobaltochelatase CobN
MLDDDCFFIYHGGLISAVKSQSGETPKSYSTNAGDPENVQTRTVHEETSRIMRARIANPKWVNGLREHGYRGAQELSAMVDIAFGWDASADVIDDWMYDMISENYLFNDEIREWIEEVNPWALHAMSERLLEAAQRGMWNASEDALNRLKNIFLSAEGEIEGL